jgi:flagellar M-ring protein FliF
MADVFKRMTEYIRNTTESMSGPQRMTVGILVVLIIGSIVWAATAATADSWVQIAGTDVPREQRNQIMLSLKEKQIVFEVRNESIYVHKENADQTVIELHGEGIFSDNLLWKFLDEGGLTASKWQQEKRYQVALQRKLEKMISKMNVVRRASVQLTPGEVRKALNFRGKGPSASVMVELHPGKEMDRKHVIAIARLVANGSMTGMEPHNVFISDMKGRPYRVPEAGEDWDLAETRLDLEKQYEKGFERKVLKLYPDVRVSVTIELSSEFSKVWEEIAGKPVAVDTESISMTDMSKTTVTVGGIKGEGTRITTASGSGINMDKKEKEDREKSFVPRKTIERHIREGKVSAKSVAVIFPVMVGEGEDPQAILAAEESKIPVLEKSIMQAVGLTDKALLSVSFMPTRVPTEPPGPTTAELAREYLDAYGGTAILLLIAGLALYIIYRLLKRALPTGLEEDLDALRRKVVQEAAFAEGDDLSVAEEEAERVKRSVRELVNKNPQGIASIIQRWMKGK